MIKAFLLTLVLAGSLAGAAVAGPSEDAEAAAERGDWATVLKLVRPLGDQGDADAQFSMGFMYKNGDGVTKDYVQGYMWFDLA